MKIADTMKMTPMQIGMYRWDSSTWLMRQYARTAEQDSTRHIAALNRVRVGLREAGSMCLSRKVATRAARTSPRVAMEEAYSKYPSAAILMGNKMKCMMEFLLPDLSSI